MRVFPAIDLLGGRVVRLTQGDYDKMTVYGDDPRAAAEGFAASGARNLHVVDLDGAKDGTTANFESVRALCAVPGLFIEVGGGIRDEARLCRYLELGVSRCILGTAAVKDFSFTTRMAQKYGERLAVGVDARDGLVAVNGWRELSRERGVDFCRRLYDAGVGTVIYTDIARDGTQNGTNLPIYRELAGIRGLAVTASGGVGSLAEIEALRAMGTAAVILGKALYAGRLDLRAALAAAGDEREA